MSTQLPTVSDGLTTATPSVVLDYAWSREARTVVHEVLGRADPDVTLRPLSTRSGTLRMLCASRATAMDLEALHLTGRVLTFTDDLGTAMRYVVAGRILVELNAGYDTWTVLVDYREVAQ